METHDIVISRQGFGPLERARYYASSSNRNHFGALRTGAFGVLWTGTHRSFSIEFTGFCLDARGTVPSANAWFPRVAPVDVAGRLHRSRDRTDQPIYWCRFS